MKKKIIVIWDLDGFIGLVNSTMPYNYKFEYHQIELEWVKRSLELLKRFEVKTTFAVTGYSAEKGIYPFTFPNLINEIAQQGHEIASHSWRHEWIPFLTTNQFRKSLERSKYALENAINGISEINGFVPPHNKPSTWIAKGAFSFEDRGLYPFFKYGDLGNVMIELKKHNYRWIRISQNPYLQRLIDSKRTKHYRVFFYNDILVLRNHRSGFSEHVIKAIKNSNHNIFTVSAHPAMLSFNDGRTESWEAFQNFIYAFKDDNNYEFVTPQQIIKDYDLSNKKN